MADCAKIYSVCVCVCVCVCECMCVLQFSDLCCSHIFTDKTYYIDPNGGSTLDAVEVVCRKFETEEGIFTCIKPTIDNIVSACTVYCCCLAMG